MASESPRPTGARAFSCVVKGPLGCLAFALGALIVLTLFFPPVGGRILDRWVEAGFTEHFEGRLELGDAWVGSFYGDQHIERVVLRDPRGDEVFSGRLTAPSFEGVLDGNGPYGPVHLTIDLLRLVLEPDGSTNLDHALALRPDHVVIRGRGLPTDRSLVVDLIVEVERARLEVPDGTSETLTGLSCTGRIEWVRDEVRLTLEGGSSAEQWAAFRFELDVSTSLGAPGHLSTSWTLVDAPAAVAALGLRPLGQLAHLAGARVDQVEGRREDAAVEAHVVDDGRELTVRGRYRPDPPALIGEASAEVLELTVDGAHLDVLGAFLPLTSAVRGEGARLRLTGYEWALEEAGDVSGSLELELATSGYELAPGIPRPPEAHDLVAGAGHLDRELLLEHGQMLFEDVRLPLDGGQLVLRGRLGLGAPGGALEARLESGAESIELGPVAPARAPVAPRPPPLRQR
jgi:hypothetical protein